jgi:exonuclease SbcC
MLSVDSPMPSRRSRRQERNRLTEQGAQLRAALDLEETLPDRSRHLEELVGLSTDAAEAHRSALASQAALPGRITELETIRATLRAHLAEEPERSRRRDNSQHRLAAAERQVTLSAEAQAEQARLGLAVTRAKDAVVTEGERRRRRLEGMAGELAGQLAPQAPCPVCGSTEHPRPATVGDQYVSAEQVERAEADRRGAEAEAEALRARVTSLEAEIARAEGEAGGATVDALRLEVAHAQAAVDEVSGDRERLTAIDQELDAAKRLSHELGGVVERAEGASRAAAETTQRTRHDLERDLELVVRARGDHASVRDREAALRSRSDVLERALEAAEVLDVCRKDVEQRTQQVQRELARAEFPDRGAAERAALSEQERHRLAAAIEVRERTLTGIAERLADPAIAVIDERAVIDVESAAELLQQREAVEQQALASLTAAEESCRRAGEGAAAVRQALLARRCEASVTEPLIRVADIVAAASSVNARAMTLSTFVLIERFRDVVAAANHRLATMSDGRYTLAHIVDKEGQRRSGLGLVVNDIHTDRPRDPKTLSGGETFYCSLALALGLADVVTAESGGVSLETLFIDEGFGSLDAATLDLVLDVLARLSRSGRTVGVVSHVTELKERIAERIQVRRLPRGTSTLEVLA